MAKRVVKEVESQIAEVQEEKKAAKKTVIKSDTPVRVFNNTTGGISFKNAKGQWHRMKHRGFVDVTYADLEHLYIEAPQILTSGSVYIAWQPVREKLGLDYENIDVVFKSERIFWKQQNSMKVHLQKWSLQKINRFLEMLLNIEKTVKFSQNKNVEFENFVLKSILVFEK